jgi:hypothetical protein
MRIHHDRKDVVLLLAIKSVEIKVTNVKPMKGIGYNILRFTDTGILLKMIFIIRLIMPRNVVAAINRLA